MDFQEEKRGLSKLEYFLIFLLIVVLAWAAWIVLEPVIRPAFDRFLNDAFQGVVATPTPTPSS